ncbi:MAG: inositol monophosphatase family protein [Acidiferrobacter sp.]
MEGRRERLSVPYILDPATQASLRVLERLVRAAAEEELMPRFGVSGPRIKGDGSVVTAADTGMQARLAAQLYEHWPQFQLLGEEMDEEEQRAALGALDGAWCLDPLDGTTNFIHGLPFFAVSLALLRYGQPVLGLVYDPLRRECFTALRGGGAWLNGEPLGISAHAPALRRCVAVVDLKRLQPRLASRLGMDPPYGSQRSFGACALDWCWLAAGRVHLYLHGGQKLWDYAAGSLILQEAGGTAATLDGRPIEYDKLENSSAVAAKTADLYEAWRAWITHNA